MEFVNHRGAGGLQVIAQVRVRLRVWEGGLRNWLLGTGIFLEGGGRAQQSAGRVGDGTA